MKLKILLAAVVAVACASAQAQINVSSDGIDGVLNPASSITINMADHPNGIYQYSSVTISNGVTVSFTPNANNTPVYWLVQSNVIINGTVNLSGQNANGGQGGLGGPGGGAGGSGGSGNYPTASSGLGAGGGQGGYYINPTNAVLAGQASFGTVGSQSGPSGPANYYQGQAAPGNVYGNNFLIPLMGGSGGGGFGGSGGGGGGGAILIAANGSITINSPGNISANGGSSCCNSGSGGGGSGGAIRLVAALISGNGGVYASGGSGFSGLWSYQGNYYPNSNQAGNGRIRFDTYQNNFSGGVSDAFTQGSQYIIIPSAGQLPQLTVTSVGGVPVSVSPTGVLSTPDAILSAQQNNPIPIIVTCANLPLNTQITVSVKPANGAAVSATGYNNTGTLSSSTATISITIPRGGGLIYATAATSN